MMVWRMVLLAAICCIIPKPVTSRSARDKGSQREKPKAMMPTPKRPAMVGITRRRPRTLFREASQAALPRAPRPEAPMRKPSVWAPPPRTRLAKMGMSTV